MSFFTKHSLSLIFFSLLTCILLMFGCGEEEKDPDLLYEFANLEMEEVDSGDPLVLQSAITNEPDICDNCTTKTSGECTRGIRVQYRPDTNSPWVDAQLRDQDGNIVFEIVKPVPEIEAAMNHVRTEGFIFTDPGLYRYRLAADRDFIVDERIETNNDAESEDGDVKAIGTTDHNRVYNLVVRVTDTSGKHQPLPVGKKPAAIIYLGDM